MKQVPGAAKAATVESEKSNRHIGEQWWGLNPAGSLGRGEKTYIHSNSNQRSMERLSKALSSLLPLVSFLETPSSSSLCYQCPTVALHSVYRMAKSHSPSPELTKRPRVDYVSYG